MARLIERELPASGTSTCCSRPATPRWSPSVGSVAHAGTAWLSGEAVCRAGVRRIALLQVPGLICAGCWLPQGHGRIGIRTALAQSCNSYFTQLAGLTAFDDLDRTASRYGLDTPGNTSPESLIGRYGNWRATPLEAARAYNELVHRRSEPGSRWSLMRFGYVLGAARRRRLGSGGCEDGHGALRPFGRAWRRTGGRDVPGIVAGVRFAGEVARRSRGRMRPPRRAVRAGGAQVKGCGESPQRTHRRGQVRRVSFIWCPAVACRSVAHSAVRGGAGGRCADRRFRVVSSPPRRGHAHGRPG